MFFSQYFLNFFFLLSAPFFLAADVLLWKRGRVSFGAIVVATISWLLFERSGLSFLSICSDVLLILVVLLFLQANYAVFRNKYEYSYPLHVYYCQPSSETVFNENNYRIL